MRERPTPDFAGKEFSDRDAVVDMARKVAEALQHMLCERARRVPIQVLALQPAANRRKPFPASLGSGAIGERAAALPLISLYKNLTIRREMGYVGRINGLVSCWAFQVSPD